MDEERLKAFYEEMRKGLPSGKGESGAFNFSFPDYSRLLNADELRTLNAYNNNIVAPGNQMYLDTFNTRQQVMRDRARQTERNNEELAGVRGPGIMAVLNGTQDQLLSRGGSVVDHTGTQRFIAQAPPPEVFDPSKLQAPKTAGEEYANVVVGGSGATHYPPSSGSSTKPKYSDVRVKVEGGDTKLLGDAGGDVFGYINSTVKPSSYKSWNATVTDLHNSIFRNPPSKIGSEMEDFLQSIYKTGDSKDSTVAALRAMFVPKGGDWRNGTDWSVASGYKPTMVKTTYKDADGTLKEKYVVDTGSDSFVRLLSLIQNLTSDKLNAYFSGAGKSSIRTKDIYDASKLIDPDRGREAATQFTQAALLMKMLGMVDAGPTRIY